tara:strand:- start:402 stop:854 length:453 start_codon:yes stop_codon:yes gene_type:complete
MKKLKAGDLAPKIECKNQDGEIIKLSDFLGKKIVIFFYPRANTPGCTAQACNLGDNYIEFKKRGYEIIGVSADNQKSQKNFSNKYNLPFNLCCDENKEIINDYGVWGLKKFRGNEYMGIIRTTFIIDEQGKIEDIIEKVKTKEHSLQILQ